MSKFFRVVYWEFISKVTEKNFLLSTLLWPIVFIAFIIAPALQYLDEEPTVRIGFIDGTQNNIFQLFTEQLSDSDQTNLSMVEILPDSIASYYTKLQTARSLDVKLDSVTDVYTFVKSERKRLFLIKKRSKEENIQFKRFYKDLKQSRNEKDSLEIALHNLNIKIEESFIFESKQRANRKLENEEMDAYIYLSPDAIRTGNVEYHTFKLVNVMQKDHIKQLVANTLMQYRLSQSRIKPSIQQKVLKPIKFVTYQHKENTENQTRTFASYIGPVIAFILLFISIFTTSGYLFNSFVSEKFSRILEFILSTSSKHTIFLAKICGIGCAGLFQITIWTLLFGFIYTMEFFELSDISYLTVSNLGYFYLYYLLGYLIYASFFSGISVIAQSQQEAHTIHQLLRLLFILPLLFAFIILNDPSAEVVRTFSLIPFLSPSLMIMRIPLSAQVPTEDILLTLYILMGTILCLYIISYRLFSVLSVYYGKRPSISEIFRILFTGKF